MTPRSHLNFRPDISPRWELSRLASMIAGPLEAQEDFVGIATDNSPLRFRAPPRLRPGRAFCVFGNMKAVAKLFGCHNISRQYIRSGPVQLERYTVKFFSAGTLSAFMVLRCRFEFDDHHPSRADSNDISSRQDTVLTNRRRSHPRAIRTSGALLDKEQDLLLSKE
jgi:hypothetical protein